MGEASEKLKGLKIKPKGPAKPVWAGPESAEDNGGITFSLLNRFISCRERFRLLVVEGLQGNRGFNHKIEYGSCWHVCEEALAANLPWEPALALYARDLCRKYPTSVEQVTHWWSVCKVQFPIYVDYWKKHKDVVERTPLLQEAKFNVPYALPSGRVVRLRGKWDSVDLIGKGKNQAIYLMENKTKGDIREQQLQRQLTFDLQTMIYLVALGNYQTEKGQYRLGGEGIPRGMPIKGVRYNVIRRPLSGGKGTITQKKGSKNVRPESKAEFYARVASYIQAEPETYFMRWKIEVAPTDIDRFRRECLDPILEQLCNWWDWVEFKEDPFEPHIESVSASMNYWEALHWRHPYGLYNVLDEGGSTDLDQYLDSGNEMGLERTQNLFPELT